MTLADILVAHRHDMLRLWMLAVRREAPETQGLSDADLTGNFPLLFDRLIKGLEGEPPPPVMPESRAHAATRKRQGIGLPTLLREFTLLQQTIRSFAAEMLGARPGDSESRTIDSILFRAVEEAVLTYTATRDAEMEDARGRMDNVIAAPAQDIRTPLNAITLTIMEMKQGDRLDDEDWEDLASTWAKPASTSPRRYSSIGIAPAMQPTKAIRSLPSSGGSSRFRAMSLTARRPPGFRTLATSRKTAALSGARLITQFETPQSALHLVVNGMPW